MGALTQGRGYDNTENYHNKGNYYNRGGPFCRGGRLQKFSSVAQSCLTLCDPMNRNMPGLPVHHQLSESTQTHVH